MPPTDLDLLSINTIRFLSADAVQKASSGHPGLPMGAAPMAYTLWTRHLRHNPRNPHWVNRDRFVLSAGHGSMLLYSLLYLTGYDLPFSELQAFRQWNSKTPGHPESHLTPGVETTTGPLGQGFGNAVGMAMAERHLAARYNRPGHVLVDHHTYAIVSDGDLMEGVASEAASLAGHLRLGKIVFLYDDNHVSIEGSTSLAFSEDVGKRFEAYGWHVQAVGDGTDLEAIHRAIVAARADPRPSLIRVRTIIGFGAPHKQGTAEAHGEPLGPDELVAAKRNLGWPEDSSFLVPGEALENFRMALERGQAWQEEWRSAFDAYRREFPELAAQFDRVIGRQLPPGWDAELPSFPADPKGQATRSASGAVLNAIAAKLPELVGGSADLAPSTKTLIKNGGDFSAENPAGRNLHFGVREHAMGAIVNGMALHGGLIPYGATFLIFSDYMRPALRLAALEEAGSIFVFTHDSIGLGEDGPTHQPIEHLAAIRAIPHMTLIRPADANETVEAWRAAIGHRRGPVCLALTRQNVPVLDRGRYAPASGLARGAYVLADLGGDRPQLILMATGSEVQLIVAAGEQLAADGIPVRLVSFPSWELFGRQSQSYRDTVFPPEVSARVAVEAGSPLGWHRWVGDRGVVIGIDRFGASAPYRAIYENFGLTAASVARHARALLEAGDGRAPVVGGTPEPKGAGRS